MLKYRADSKRIHVCALNALPFHAQFMLTACRKFSNTGYLGTSGLHWQFSGCFLFCSWTAGHNSLKVEKCCRPSQLIWQIMTDTASNTVHCDTDLLLCSECLLPCLGAASSSCIRYCIQSSTPPWAPLSSLPNLWPPLDSLQQNMMFLLTSCTR